MICFVYAALFATTKRERYHWTSFSFSVVSRLHFYFIITSWIPLLPRIFFFVFRIKVLGLAEAYKKLCKNQPLTSFAKCSILDA